MCWKHPFRHRLSKWQLFALRLKTAGYVFFGMMVAAILMTCVCDRSPERNVELESKGGVAQTRETAENAPRIAEETRGELCPTKAPPGYYVARDGIDAGNRGTSEAPWRTLSYALGHLQAGDTLYVRGGTYYERDLAIHLSGTAGKPIVIQGYPCENAVVDGGFPAFRDIGNEDWELFDPALDEWRSKAAVDVRDKSERVFGFILDISNYPNKRVRLVPYADPQNLLTINEVHAEDEHDAAPIYIGPGAWRDPESGHIHIRLVNSLMPIPPTRDPRKLSLHLSTASSVLEISGSAYLTVRNLTLQNARHAIRLERVNHHLIFDGITTWALSGIFVPMDKNDSASSFVTVSRSRLYNDHPRWIYWSDVKRPPEEGGLLETGAISLRSGSHNWDIAWNHFRGGFDGPSQRRDTGNIRYHHNLVEAYADDAFELEGACSDVQVYENYIRHTHTGVAISPCTVGPVYVYRNVIANLDEFRFRRPHIKLYDSTRTKQIGHPFKFAEYSGTGERRNIAAIYQNTIVFLGREGEGARGVAWVNHQIPEGHITFNNIGYVVNGVVAGDYGDTNLGQQIDGNLYFKANTTDGANLLDNIAGSHFSSLASLHASATFQASKASYPPGWDANGIEGDPLFSGFTSAWDTSSTFWKSIEPFMDWSVDAFFLQPESRARGRGIQLPKTLPDTRRPPLGVRPDIGAIPFGEAFSVGPDAGPQNRAGGAALTARNGIRAFLTAKD
ncbi:MAG: hypothetical protein L0Z68_03275 [Gammaproteobacteria bacterium]|nr:hypothetical protein [Gammaproteobacteria bacterium]